MTKKILLKWLEEQKAVALEKAKAIQAKELAAHDAALYETVGLDAIASKVQALLTEAEQVVADWHKEHSDLIGEDRTGRYGTIHNTLYSWLHSETATRGQLISYEISKDAAGRRTLQSKHSELCRQIEKNYDAVIMNVSRVANAKRGVDYLKELGFDMSTLEVLEDKPNETALALLIDTRFLLLGGAQDEN